MNLFQTGETGQKRKHLVKGLSVASYLPNGLSGCPDAGLRGADRWRQTQLPSTPGPVTAPGVKGTPLPPHRFWTMGCERKGSVIPDLKPKWAGKKAFPSVVHVQWPQCTAGLSQPPPARRRPGENHLVGAESSKRVLSRGYPGLVNYNTSPANTDTL